MPIIIDCTQCRRKLSVAETLLGQMVRCPSCGTTFTVQAAAAPLPPGPTVGPPHSLPPPVPTSPPAPPAAPLLPQDSPWGTPTPSDRGEFQPPGSGEFTAPQEELQQEFEEAGKVQTSGRPHRGRLIMIFGILGLALSCCMLPGWILGGLAISWGSSDLLDMSHGRMDRSGQEVTEKGRLCGIIAVSIASVLFGVGSLVWLYNLRFE